MKPEAPLTHSTPEQRPVRDISSVERVPNLGGLETSAETGAEFVDKKSEINAIMADVNMTTVLPTPVLSPSIVADNTTIIGNPLVANDDDLIEKEWVDKAKKIVAETHDDPYRRDAEVNKLQIDYIKKRFGRELGVAE